MNVLHLSCCWGSLDRENSMEGESWGERSFVLKGLLRMFCGD